MDLSLGSCYKGQFELDSRIRQTTGVQTLVGPPPNSQVYWVLTISMAWPRGKWTTLVSPSCWNSEARNLLNTGPGQGNLPE